MPTAPEESQPDEVRRGCFGENCDSVGQAIGNADHEEGVATREGFRYPHGPPSMETCDQQVRSFLSGDANGWYTVTLIAEAICRSENTVGAALAKLGRGGSASRRWEHRGRPYWSARPPICEELTNLLKSSPVWVTVRRAAEICGRTPKIVGRALTSMADDGLAIARRIRGGRVFRHAAGGRDEATGGDRNAEAWGRSSPACRTVGDDISDVLESSRRGETARSIAGILGTHPNKVGRLMTPMCERSLVVSRSIGGGRAFSINRGSEGGCSPIAINLEDATSPTEGGTSRPIFPAASATARYAGVIDATSTAGRRHESDEESLPLNEGEKSEVLELEGDSESTASGGERQPQEPISGHCDKVSGAHLP